jgi:voltage-gated potassium channel
MAAETNLTREDQKTQLHEERWELLEHLICLTCKPMTVLSFVWVALVIVNFVSSLPLVLQWLSTAIWALFILDFLVELLVAPHKLTYVRQNWLTAISLALPALSMLRILQALRIVRLMAVSGSFSLLRIVTACNRGMIATRRVLGHRKLGYIIALTLLILLAGAAGMYAFENPVALRAQGYGAAVHGGAGLQSYGEALWWTAMVMTTLGSAYWPLTLAGRILCFLLALYALSVFGYITATVASFFIGGTNHGGEKQSARKPVTDMSSLQRELAAVREELAALVARLDAGHMPATMAREPQPSGSHQVASESSRQEASAGSQFRR